MKLFLIETLVTTKHIYVVEAPDLDSAQDMIFSGEFEESFSQDTIAENLLSAGEVEEDEVPDIFYDDNPALVDHPYFTPEAILNRIERFK